MLKQFSWKMVGNVCNVSFVGYHGFIRQVWAPVWKMGNNRLVFCLSQRRDRGVAALADSTNFSALVFMVFILWALHPPLQRNVMDTHSSEVFSGPVGPFVSFIKVWIYCVSEVGRKLPNVFLFSKQTQAQRTSFILQITHPFSG